MATTVTKVEKSSDGTSTTTTVKKTTIDTMDVDEAAIMYRPYIQQKQLIVQRSMASPGRQMSSQYSRDQSSRYGGYGGFNTMNPNAYVTMASQGVIAVKDSRDKEKKDMQDLNERLANYIEKARFLEALNRSLEEKLKKLQDKWGSDRNYGKEMYEKELKEARRLLEEANIEKHHKTVALDNAMLARDEWENKYGLAAKEIIDKRDEISRYIQLLADVTGERDLLRSRYEAFEKDRERDKAQLKKVQDLLNTARVDLNNQTLLHIDAENRRQTLEEELEFLKMLHEQEMKEQQALAYNDSSDVRKYWTSHMDVAIRDIQEAYDDKLETIQMELENNYTLKLQQYQTGATKFNMETSHSKEECKRLREQMGPLREKLSEQESRIAHLTRELELLRREKEESERDLEQRNGELTQECALLRAKMEATLKEIQTILDSKLGLELEIAAYRSLLEGEEHRAGLRQLVNTSDEYLIRQTDVVQGGSVGVTQITKGEMAAKTTYQKSAKGPVGIYECGADGKYVALENSGRKDEDLGGWSLTRNIDGKDSASYKFKDGFALKPNEKIKVWSHGKKPSDAAPNDLEADKEWGVGAHIITKLVNPTGEDRASHIQKTQFST